MKQALCFPTLTSEKAKKVLNWLIYGEFTLGFYMYDICRVGTFAGSIDKMDASTYSIVVHSGETYLCVGPIPAKIQVSHVFKWATD